MNNQVDNTIQLPASLARTSHFAKATPLKMIYLQKKVNFLRKKVFLLDAWQTWKYIHTKHMYRIDLLNNRLIRIPCHPTTYLATILSFDTSSNFIDTTLHERTVFIVK